MFWWWEEKIVPETKHSATPLAYAKICGPCEIREFPSSCTMSWLELEPRFVDCDDLNDPTRVLNYVGQEDTETLVVLGSPELLTRKWCVGEICTARIPEAEFVVGTLRMSNWEELFHGEIWKILKDFQRWNEHKKYTMIRMMQIRHDKYIGVL